MDSRVVPRLRPGTVGGPRGRVLEAAYALFSRRGIRDVGVEELVSAAGVTKSTFYRHFPSKDDLVLAYLERRYQERRAAMEAAIADHAGGEEAILAVFDVFEAWFARDAPEVVAFVQVLIEMGPQHRLGKASAGYMASNRASVAELAAAAGLLDPDGFAWSVHILVQGAIIADLEGDPDAAGRARRTAALLIRHHRPAAAR